MTALLAWLAGTVGVFLSSQVARWIAWKTIISLVVITILPIIINNAIYDLINVAINMTSGVGSGVSPWVQSFTGLGGWLLAEGSVPQALSIILSAVAIRYTLGLIPFVRA